MSEKGKKPKLGHDFVYSVNNNKIEAYCTHAGCDYTENNKIALTLTAEDRDYSGSPYQGADVVDEITPVVDGTSVTKTDIQYYKRGESTALASAPADAGQYTAKVTLGGKTAAVDFTIRKASQSATVAMADYSLIGTVSTPTISGQKESPTVTYYYNTTNSNENGTKWENISVDTLTPGIYYMYATLSETDNYKAYTTPTTSFRVGSRPTSIQNGSFETPAIGSWYSIMSETTPSIAWETTASDGKIEFARPSKNMSAANSAYHTTTAVDGYQFAELCANQVGALYQTVSTFSGDTLEWGFSHKGRSGNDTMELWIGTPADVTAVLDYYKSHNNSVTGISENPELSAKYQTISQNSDGTKRSYTDGNTQWKSYTGTYDVPAGQTETTFAFVSIAASGNRISYGNLLDNVYFTTQVPVKTQLFEYDATSGGSVTASVDDIPVDGKETFVSEGSTIKFSQSANNGYTYNGGFVNGSYISMDKLPLSYTVSENDTDLKHITFLFSKDSTIIFDKEGGAYEDDEYDLKAAGNNQYYELKANPTKEGYAFKNWLIAGSTQTLTAGNYIAYETVGGKTYIRVYQDSSKKDKLYECASGRGINLIATYQFMAFPSATVVLDMGGGNVAGKDSITYKLDELDLNDSATQEGDIEYNAITLPTPSKGVYAFQGWKIGENVYDAGTDIKYALSASNQNGTVTIGKDTQSAITTDTTYTLKAQWETIPMQGVTATGVSKVYDGTPSAAITVSELPANTTVTYGTTEGTYSLSVCPTYTDVGTYTVYYKVSGDGYKDYTGSADITINPRPVTLNWSSTELTYTGSEQEVTAEVSNKASDTDSFTITYNDNKKTAAGEYTATVTGLGNDNYTLTGVTGKEFTISPKEVNATVSVADRAYNGTKTAEVTATVDAGIAGQTLTITGLTGTFADKNAGTGKIVAINSTSAVVTGGTGTNAGNYKVTYPATSTANIRAVALTVKVKDVEKHIGYEDPAFTYTITSGSLVDGETLSGISYSRDAGETAGEYNITATETSGSNSNYVLTLQTGKLTIVDHTVVTDSAVAPTCTTTGLTEGSHCSVCSKVITAQTTVPALGHDWSGEWTVINQPTDTEEGKKEKTCSREGCGVKKYEVLPKNGSTDDLPANVNGTLEKSAEVAPDSPIQEATLDNKKSELLNAPNIFTDGEKQQIAGGADAKVWLEVTKTDESNIPTEDKTKVENEAKNIMGDHPTITYFDVDLYKQIAGDTKQRLHEPGINIKVTILIPSDLLNHERTIVREYKIIRLHDNDVSVLSGEFDEASKEFTFETDKFSTYAIAYSDIQLVTGITLTPDSATLTNKGETVQLTATVTPENAADKSVTWASSNTNVATVDANGKVTAVANGTCTITVTTTDGEKTATSTITVTIPSDDTGNNGDDGNTNDKKNNKPKAPETGDDNNLALWFSLLFMSLAGLAVFFARKKKDCK